MKKIVMLLLVAAISFGVALPCYAAEYGEIVTTDVYAKYIRATNQNAVPVENMSASITTENGYFINITGVPANAVYLKIVPIPASEQEAWNWFKACLGDEKKPLIIFNIYFEDADGNRINASGVKISISSVGDETTVFSVTTSGTTVELNCNIADSSISFTANGSHYYALTQKITSAPVPDNHVTIEDPEGGDVEISDDNPETGDTVTIFPIPDEGTEVDKVIVKDENGNEVPVTDNGDGTYSYVQPDSNVTIKVTFRDTTIFDNPQTGDSSYPLLWIGMMFASPIAILWIIIGVRKRRKNEG